MSKNIDITELSSKFCEVISPNFTDDELKIISDIIRRYAVYSNRMIGFNLSDESDDE